MKDWFCHTCNAPADYRANQQNFCTKHWEVHLGLQHCNTNEGETGRFKRYSELPADKHARERSAGGAARSG